MDFNQLLKFAVENKASDVHIQAGLQPRIRLGGMIRTVNLPTMSDDDVRGFIEAITPERLKNNLEQSLMSGFDFSHASPTLGRFRCSAYQQLGVAGIVMRIIRGKIPSLAELNLPPVINDIALSRRGLTLVTGTTGSGKSTTLAAMIDLINSTEAAKIIAIEDPVEYLHTPKQALITQFEVGSDTPSFEQALRQSLRQDPDVILIGELRDVETLKIALRAADTGHQVFSTVHSSNAPQTIERIIAMFPPAEHKLLLTQLVGNLEAIVSQKLLLCRDGTLRPAVEVLRGSPVASKYILDGKAMELGDYMRTAGEGQQTFDQDLLAMVRKELITAPEALTHANNPEALSMALRGIGGSNALGDVNKPSKIRTQ